MKQKSQAKTSEQLGVRHFLEFMYDGQPEWSLFAVKAAADKSADGILGAGGPINEACDNCHERYQRQ